MKSRLVVAGGVGWGYRSGKEVGVVMKRQRGDPCGDTDGLYLKCISVNFLL